MKKIIYLLMSLSFVAFASCEDKDNTNDGNGSMSENSSSVSYSSGTENGHEYVDLGLPSGTLWATCNVGATKPEEFGNYYAWGEVEPKEYYGWSNYKYGSAYIALTKYCTDSYYGKDGFTDSKTTLDLSDDAAYVNWGGKWRMPTKAQQDELRSECYWVWARNYKNSSVRGYVVYKAKSSSDKGVSIYYDGTPSSSYSLSDAHIFLPAAGLHDGSNANFYGYYWSSSLTQTDEQHTAWDIGFHSDGISMSYSARYYGQSVRAVFK